MIADVMHIESVTITPNPVTAGQQFGIEVEIYTLFPALDKYPSGNLYPGEDLFTLCPRDEGLYPANDLYPTEGGIES